jgi:hypothetical protein
MATPEQKAASRDVMDAVTALNKAMTNAGAQALFVDLVEIRLLGSRNPQYTVKIETRETLLP